MRRVWASTIGAWLLVLVAAVGLSAMIPPMQSPDEHSHILRAYLVSKGEITLSTPAGMSSGGQVDRSLLYFVNAYLSTTARSAQGPLDPARRAAAESLRWSSNEHFFPVAGTGYYMPLVYVPHAAGLLAGRVLGLTVADTYRLVRLALLLSCVGLLAAAWRIMRPPALAIALLLLPMTLFQLLSPTLDGLTTSLAVLALSVFWIGVSRGNEWPPGRAWLLAVCVTLLATTRIQLFPLLGMPFFVAWVRRSRRDAFLGVAATLLSLAWVAYALSHTVDLRIQRADSTGQLLMQYAAHPLAFFEVVAASLADSKLGPFYSDTFIGVLGWLDTMLPEPAYPALWIGLALCAAASVPGARLREAWLARLLLALAAAACALLVFLALLVTWTPHPAAVVEGVQGRYFIVPAIMLAYAIGAPTRRRPIQAATFTLLAAFAGVSLYSLVTTMLARYH
jgi:uncharacterized membrane protein